MLSGTGVGSWIGRAIRKDLLAHEIHASFIGSEKTGNDLRERALSTAVRTKHAEPFAVGYG